MFSDTYGNLSRVAGVQTPAFVERILVRGLSGYGMQVSPEFQTPAFVERSPRRTCSRPTRWCRRSSDSGLR